MNEDTAIFSVVADGECLGSCGSTILGSIDREIEIVMRCHVSSPMRCKAERDDFLAHLRLLRSVAWKTGNFHGVRAAQPNSSDRRRLHGLARLRGRGQAGGRLGKPPRAVL